MRKLVALCLAVMLVLSLAGCGNSPRGERVFDTEHATAVTFFISGTKDGYAVPQEDLAEILEWLGTFTVAEKAEKTLPTGTNRISVRIEYAGGVTISHGLGTTEIEGTHYYMKHKDAPECYTELFD